MQRISKLVLNGALLGSLLAVAAAADATTVLYLSREELVARSQVVVRVTVGASSTTERADGAAILRHTDLVVKDVLKGALPAQAKALTVEQIGGSFHGRTQYVEGDGRFVAGEDAVVFLRLGEGGVYNLTALGLSLYHVDGNGMVHRDLGGLTLMSKAGGRLAEAAPSEPPETVEHLMTDVVRAAGSK